MLRRAISARVICADVTYDLAQMPAGQDVVADIGDAIGREILGTDAEDRVLCIPGHPTENTVTDDVVELPVSKIDNGKITFADLNVGQPQLSDRLPCILDVANGQV